MERTTLCLPHYGTKDVLHNGNDGFRQEQDRLCRSEESEALEALLALKTKLRPLSTDDFWVAVTEGICSILGAEMSFVMKRELYCIFNAVQLDGQLPRPVNSTEIVVLSTPGIDTNPIFHKCRVMIGI